MIYRKWTVLLCMAIALAISSGCVYRANIAQGNLIKEEDLDQVEIGMTKNQVRFLLGTPMVDDPFDKKRWDYVYYITLGRKDARFKRWVTVFFDEEEVIEIRKDQELDPNL